MEENRLSASIDSFKIIQYVKRIHIILFISFIEELILSLVSYREKQLTFAFHKIIIFKKRSPTLGRQLLYCLYSLKLYISNKRRKNLSTGFKRIYYYSLISQIRHFDFKLIQKYISTKNQHLEISDFKNFQSERKVNKKQKLFYFLKFHVLENQIERIEQSIDYGKASGIVSASEIIFTRLFEKRKNYFLSFIASLSEFTKVREISKKFESITSLHKSLFCFNLKQKILNIKLLKRFEIKKRKRIKGFYLFFNTAKSLYLKNLRQKFYFWKNSNIFQNAKKVDQIGNGNGKENLIKCSSLKKSINFKLEENSKYIYPLAKILNLWKRNLKIEIFLKIVMYSKKLILNQSIQIQNMKNIKSLLHIRIKMLNVKSFCQIKQYNKGKKKSLVIYKENRNENFKFQNNLFFIIGKLFFMKLKSRTFHQILIFSKKNIYCDLSEVIRNSAVTMKELSKEIKSLIIKVQKERKLLLLRKILTFNTDDFSNLIKKTFLIWKYKIPKYNFQNKLNMLSKLERAEKQKTSLSRELNHRMNLISEYERNQVVLNEFESIPSTFKTFNNLNAPISEGSPEKLRDDTFFEGSANQIEMEYFNYLQDQNEELKRDLLSINQNCESTKIKHLKRKAFLEDIVNQFENSNSISKDKILNRSFDKSLVQRRKSELNAVKRCPKKVLSAHESISD